jgi:hypothetical protein
LQEWQDRRYHYAMARNEAKNTAEPRGERPEIPKEYGVPESLAGVLPWRWAEERLERAKNYWVVTVRPDGRPHAVPVWGMWVNRRFYFGGGGRKAKNLATNRSVVVHLESGDEVITVEGIADGPAPLAPEVVPRLREASLAKYEYWPDDPEPVFTVRPHTVIAWHSFPKDATRWRFSRAPRAETP